MGWRFVAGHPAVAAFFLPNFVSAAAVRRVHRLDSQSSWGDKLVIVEMRETQWRMFRW